MTVDVLSAILRTDFLHFLLLDLLALVMHSSSTVYELPYQTWHEQRFAAAPGSKQNSPALTSMSLFVFSTVIQLVPICYNELLLSIPTTFPIDNYPSSRFPRCTTKLRLKYTSPGRRCQIGIVRSSG